jgi:hypothetical protein
MEGVLRIGSVSAFILGPGRRRAEQDRRRGEDAEDMAAARSIAAARISPIYEPIHGHPSRIVGRCGIDAPRGVGSAAISRNYSPQKRPRRTQFVHSRYYGHAPVIYAA